MPKFDLTTFFFKGSSQRTKTDPAEKEKKSPSIPDFGPGFTEVSKGTFVRSSGNIDFSELADSGYFFRVDLKSQKWAKETKEAFDMLMKIFGS